jgi:hypothetical protein
MLIPHYQNAGQIDNINIALNHLKMWQTSDILEQHIKIAFTKKLEKIKFREN